MCFLIFSSNKLHMSIFFFLWEEMVIIFATSILLASPVVVICHFLQSVTSWFNMPSFILIYRL